MKNDRYEKFVGDIVYLSVYNCYLKSCFSSYVIFHNTLLAYIKLGNAKMMIGHLKTIYPELYKIFGYTKDESDRVIINFFLNNEI